MGVTHFTFNFGPRYQRGHRIDHQDINGAASHKHIGNFQCLLAGVRLGNEQVVTIDPEFFGIRGVQRMFRIDECGNAVFFLRFGHCM